MLVMLFYESFSSVSSLIQACCRMGDTSDPFLDAAQAQCTRVWVLPVVQFIIWLKILRGCLESVVLYQNLLMNPLNPP